MRKRVGRRARGAAALPRAPELPRAPIRGDKEPVSTPSKTTSTLGAQEMPQKLSWLTREGHNRRPSARKARATANLLVSPLGG
jgi:hypothetical protein